ncbi:MAG: zinc finger domain-containing protein [archaeon]
MAKTVCNSCKTELSNQRGSTIFKCPNCEKYEIARCKHCRQIAARYHCPNCEFSGPN